jgi:hypothetical protein
MTLEVKKLYIDSRYRTADSSSDNDFKIQLGRNIVLPDNCQMHIEHCVVPHSWYNIETGINDTMYYSITESGATTYHTITIPSTNYSGTTLVTALNTLLGSWTYFGVSLNVNTNSISITIQAGKTFKILTDAELATQLNGAWTGPSYNPSQPNSCNDIITNRTPYTNTNSTPWTSGMLNLQGFRAVYISSSTITNYNVLGPRGETNIIKKVLTSSDFGYSIIDEVVSDHDYLDCSRLTLNTLEFQVKDCKGNLIPFHDSPISFCVVFTIKP